MSARRISGLNKTMMSFTKTLDNGKPFKRVSQEELTELVVKAQQGDEDAKLQVIRNTYRFVMKFVMKSHARFSVDPDDLIQVGLMGVLVAIERYKSELGFSFLTYSGHWIQQHIERYFKNASRSIRVPVHAWEEYMSVVKAFSEYKEEMGDDAPSNVFKASNELLSSISGLPVDKVQIIKTNFLTSAYNIELDATVNLNNGENDMNQADVFGELSVDESVTIIDDINSIEVSKNMLTVLKTLPARERFIIARRFGILNDGDSQTLEEIGTVLGITRERVRQIEVKGLRMLKFKLSRCFQEGELSLDDKSLNDIRIAKPKQFKDTSIFREAELDLMSDCL